MGRAAQVGEGRGEREGAQGRKAVTAQERQGRGTSQPSEHTA